MGFRPDCRRYGMDFAFSPVKGKKMQKRIVVLGGVGFIGSHLCLRLLNDGHEVFCVDIRDTADSPLLRDMPPHPEFRYVRHNIVNAFGIRCDEIYNLAAPSRVRYNKALPVESLKVSILGSINALDTARSEHARILYASTGDIYGTGYRDTSVEAADGCPTHRTLAEGKRAGEALHRAYQYEFGVDARIARIFNTYGSGADLMDQRVVMKMIVAALQNRDIPINGSGEQLPDLLLGGRRGRRTGAADGGPAGRDDAHGQFRQQSRGDDRSLAEKIIALTGSSSHIVHAEARIDDIRRRTPDISATRRELDWAPRTPLIEGLRRTISYVEKELAEKNYAGISWVEIN